MYNPLKAIINSHDMIQQCIMKFYKDFQPFFKNTTNVQFNIQNVFVPKRK